MCVVSPGLLEETYAMSTLWIVKYVHQNQINGLWVMFLGLNFITGVGKRQLTDHFTHA